MRNSLRIEPSSMVDPYATLRSDSENQRLRLIVSCVISSNVVTARAFAWKPRCATINDANSFAMSTFESSNAPPLKVPRPPVPGLPMTACPEDNVAVKSFCPERTRPCVLAKFASTSCPITAVLPLLNVPVIIPSEPIANFVIEPLPLPSCCVDAVPLGVATCVTNPLVPSYNFQSKVRSLAPSASPVTAIPVTSPAGVAMFPFPSKVNAPVLTTTGLPVAPTSAAGIEIE